MSQWTEEAARAFLTGKVGMASAARTEFDSKATQNDFSYSMEWIGRDVVKAEIWAKLANKSLNGHPAFTLLERIRQHAEDSLKKVIRHAASPPNSTNPWAVQLAILEAQVHGEYVEMFHPDYYGVMGGNPVNEPLYTPQQHETHARAWEEANPEAFAQWKARRS